MKTSLIETVLFGLAIGSYGWEHKSHDFRPPRIGDSRSPCPGLNALANHGWLPRSGKDIDLPTFQSAISGGYNYEPTTMDGIFQLALNLNLSTTGNQSTFNLFDLARHDNIEFDGSLSRNDIYFGDNVHFDPIIWATVAKNLNLYSTLGSEMNQYVSVESAAKACAARAADAKKVNPSFNSSAMQVMGNPGTTGLYLVTLWDENAGAAPKSWVRALFGMFRLCFRYSTYYETSMLII
ncbi:Chloroperoxidase [Penicillium robsamsonii]|uniref:Chloroperoxidase n=1 Tax=Penicillium robsamsonii TaxID=1792511 RepID=UPI002546C2D7|nr:Chloroperoxidase [Penicillium robsamsonii]KAJ5835677.1 Chloroperoxidase [Penicillium robsamsonii]